MIELPTKTRMRILMIYFSATKPHLLTLKKTNFQQIQKIKFQKNPLKIIFF
jgi:hypothetical protein